MKLTANQIAFLLVPKKAQDINIDDINLPDFELPDADEESPEASEELTDKELAGLEPEKKEYASIPEAARDFVTKNPNQKATCCFDWVKQVYDAAGYSPRQVYQDLNYTGRIAGDHHASPAQMASIQPGDWLYINNRNNLDTHGNHSVIFLGWQGNNIAQVASYFGGSSHIHTYDINKYPIVHISKPMKKASKSARLEALYKIAQLVTDLEDSEISDELTDKDLVGLEEKFSGYKPPIRSEYINIGAFSPGVSTDPRHKSGHNGIDFMAPRGTPIYAIAPGIVTNVGTNALGGNVVNTSHENGKVKAYYAHLDSTNVKVGDEVNYDTVLGSVGNTGNASSTCPHCHFELKENGTLIDPGRKFPVKSYNSEAVMYATKNKCSIREALLKLILVK